jgi:hypothetical protein
MALSDKFQDLAALYPRKFPGTHLIEGCMAVKRGPGRWAHNKTEISPGWPICTEKKDVNKIKDRQSYPWA